MQHQMQQQQMPPQQGGQQGGDIRNNAKIPPKDNRLKTTVRLLVSACPRLARALACDLARSNLEALLLPSFDTLTSPAGCHGNEREQL